MKNLQMPHSYISVSEEELRSISGGGPLGDALDLFFSNLRLDDPEGGVAFQRPHRLLRGPERGFALLQRAGQVER